MFIVIVVHFSYQDFVWILCHIMVGRYSSVHAARRDETVWNRLANRTVFFPHVHGSNVCISQAMILIGIDSKFGPQCFKLDPWYSLPQDSAGSRAWERAEKAAATSKLQQLFLRVPTLEVPLSTIHVLIKQPSGVIQYRNYRCESAELDAQGSG